MTPTKVFLSGGFKSNWQKTVITSVNEDRFTFFDPSQHNMSDPRQYTAWDIHYIKCCDIVFAFMENNNPSGIGLAFEIGYACALNKTVILVDTKSGYDYDFKRYFEIVKNSNIVLLEDLESGINYLKYF